MYIALQSDRMLSTIAHPDELETKAIPLLPRVRSLSSYDSPKHPCVSLTVFSPSQFLKDMLGYRFSTFLLFPNGSRYSPEYPGTPENSFQYMKAIGIRVPRFVRMSRPISYKKNAEWKRSLEACLTRTNILCSFTFTASQVFRSAKN